jgi:Asp/Glu/hydantoin racemase
MSQIKIAMIHTVPGAAEQFGNLAREVIGDISIVHIEDGAIREMLFASGGLSPKVYRRVIDDIVVSVQAGASIVQLTCSSISPVTEIADRFVNVPVLKVDEPMIRAAIRIGKRIGVIATAKPTLLPTMSEITKQAQLGSIDIQVSSVLVDYAYPFLVSGDYDRYSNLIKEAILKTMLDNDVIILAQASMARAAEIIEESERRVPVLTSPRFAVEELRKYVLRHKEETSP